MKTVSAKRIVLIAFCLLGAGPDGPASQFGQDAEIVRKQNSVAVLREVRTAQHPGFDRIVFEFEGGRAPECHVESVDQYVRKCGSGKVVDAAGKAWLKVTFTPAQAHSNSGEATVKERERPVNLRVLKELELICDFEGKVSWLLGLSSPNAYRVLELSEPTRIVVDLKH